MTSLTVWKFDDADAAEAALETIDDLEKRQLITVLDSAVVSWPAGKRHPKTRQRFSPAAAGAADGAFWGLLFGILFFVPIIGLAVGAVSAALGALSGSMVDFGIDDRFIDEVRSKVTEGTSALFLMSVNENVERIQEAFAGQKAELISTNLTSAQEDALEQTFAAH